MCEVTSSFETSELRVTLSDLDRIVNHRATCEDIRLVWRTFVGLVGGNLTGIVSCRPVDSARLADIYRVRAESFRLSGREGGGFDQSVRALEACQGHVLLGLLMPARYFAVCFLTLEMDRMIGFVYVKNN
jgi:hypothetical protein